MNTRILLLLTAIFCIPVLSVAQNIKLINSTEQSWSGGIAGHSGQNFVFTIKFSDLGALPEPDTIWIGQQPVPVLVTEGSFSQNTNTKVIKTKNSLTFEIHAGISRDDHEDRYPIQGGEQKAKPHAPTKYSGVALLSYHYMGQQRYYEISKIMKRYDPVITPETLVARC